MFESFLDLHAAKLFVALRQGSIVSTGKRISNRSLAQLLRQAAEDQSHREQFDSGFTNAKASKRHVRAPDWYGVDWDPIPKEFWNSRNIDWNHCCAQGDETGYAFVLVETAQLFEAFPVPKEQLVKRVSQVGNGYVLLDDEGNAVNPAVISKGRPAYDWNEFNVEMARRARDRTLPVKQETLIAEMQAWCLARWGHEVGRSTLLQKIKPYYDALMRSSES